MFIHSTVPSCGQSYKGSTIVNYDSRVVSDLKIPHITTLEPKIYNCRAFIRLAPAGMPIFLFGSPLNGLFCGQSYKHFTLVNYDSRVTPDWKIPHITTLEA